MSAVYNLTMPIFETKKRYAFIDAQNTASTTKKLLGFVIDWNKLHNYLMDKWKCDKVFLYSGIDEGDTETAKGFESLSEIGCIIKTRTVYSYKRPNKTVTVKCVNCGRENIKTVDMGYNRKSNCDVDLTVDAIEHAGPDAEFLVFTGDGDFDYLIQKVVEKETKVFVVASNAGINKNGINTKRLSIRIKRLVNQYEQGRINLIDINSWKMKIQK